MKHSPYTANEERLRHLLRDIRQQKEITQTALAEILDKPQSFVSKYESGERLLSFVETINVCRAIGVSPEILLKEYLPNHDT